MSKNEISAAEMLEDLTPGSVWLRENGKSSRVLFVTNQHFPEKILRSYPMQVVYADENDNIISTPVGDFIAKRTFYNVDPDLEQRLLNLVADDASENFELGEDDLTLQVEDDADEADEANEEIHDESTIADAPAAVDVASAPVEEPEPAITYQLRTDGTEVIARDYLARMTRGYSQAPAADGINVLNTLFIDAAAGIDQFTLTEAFVGQDASYNFTVATASGSISVEWDEFVGVYPMVAHNQTSYQVLFYTYPVVDEAPEVSQPAAEPVVHEQVAVIATQEVPQESIAAAKSDAPSSQMADALTSAFASAEVNELTTPGATVA